MVLLQSNRGKRIKTWGMRNSTAKTISIFMSVAVRYSDTYEN